MTNINLKLKQFQVSVFRAPITEPVRTSFGIMRDRPLVLVAIGDAEGRTGWGEIWCNFPSCGAEHRANLFTTEIVPLLQSKEFSHPYECFDYLSKALHLLVNQTGESGPVAQVIAGVDIALWDLYAQSQSLPLYQSLQAEFKKNGVLDPTTVSVPVYASGLNPTKPEKRVKEKLDDGYDAFKLKVGFDNATDLRNLEALRELVGVDRRIMVDANQGWDLPQASFMVDAMAEFNPYWVEEPLPVDAPDKEWQELARHPATRLAGGENLKSITEFDTAIDSGVFQFIQPDIAKWGGLSGTLGVAQRALTSGLTYCPHWLGGGVGLRASAHMLAAVGGKGLLEIDANPNPLRDDLLQSQNAAPVSSPQFWQPQNQPGLDIILNLDIVDKFKVLDWRST